MSNVRAREECMEIIAVRNKHDDQRNGLKHVRAGKNCALLQAPSLSTYRMQHPGYHLDGLGLVFVVMPSGYVHWEKWDKPAERINPVVLGTYPDMSLLDARKAINKNHPAVARELKKLKTPNPLRISTDAPWARVIRENSEAAGHALAARVLELSADAISDAIRKASWQAISEILGADRVLAEDEYREGTRNNKPELAYEQISNSLSKSGFLYISNMQKHSRAFAALTVDQRQSVIDRIVYAGIAKVDQKKLVAITSKEAA